jgi:predicted nucleotidyltransferase
MRSMPDHPANRLPLRREDWERFGVVHAWLFGSRARGEGDHSSDWDFLVQFASPPDFNTFMGLKEHLEKVLGGRVDVVSRAACKARFLAAIEADLLDVA